MVESAHTNPLRVQILNIEHIDDQTARVTISADDFSTPVFTVLKSALEDPGFLRMLAYGINFTDTVYTTRRETAKDRLRRSQ